jgi:hypothetical protein
MAMLKVGDWVSITPTPDTGWAYWSSRHTSMSGEYAEIVDINPGQDDPNVLYLHLRTVNTDGETELEAWFKDSHVILAKKADVYSSNNLKRACQELQEWESKRRRLLDDSLRSVFVPEKKKSEEKAPLPKPKKKGRRINLADVDGMGGTILLDDVDELWEEETVEINLDDLSFEPEDYEGWDWDGSST